jgi:RsiW-degrading membrane proteinase PrsW (M82 family)
MALSILELAVVLFAAVAPSVVYIIWIRNAEMCQREDLRSILLAFLLGAFFSLGAAFLIETGVLSLLFGDGGIFARPFWILDPKDPSVQLAIMACIVAPLVEEMTKAWGISFFRNRFTELENGLVYGAAVGLGFAAFENILYESDALSQGLTVFLATAVARALTSTALHASASSIVGYGLGRRHMLRSKGIRASWLPYYFLAVLLHGAFNLLAIAGQVSGSEWVALFGVLASLILVQQTIKFIVKKIKELDQTYACAPGKTT